MGLIVKMLVSSLLILLHTVSISQTIIIPTLGAGTLTFTIPALSSLTQAQLIYLTAGGLSKIRMLKNEIISIVARLGSSRRTCWTCCSIFSVG